MKMETMTIVKMLVLTFGTWICVFALKIFFNNLDYCIENGIKYRIMLRMRLEGYLNDEYKSDLPMTKVYFLSNIPIWCILGALAIDLNFFSIPFTAIILALGMTVIAIKARNTELGSLNNDARARIDEFERSLVKWRHEHMRGDCVGDFILSEQDNPFKPEPEELQKPTMTPRHKRVQRIAYRQPVIQRRDYNRRRV